MIGKHLRKIILTIALNVLHAKKKKKYPAYASKQNSNRENQVIILMISNRGTKLGSKDMKLSPKDDKNTTTMA